MIEAEQSVLGCIFYNSDYLDDIFLETKDNDFNNEFCREIFKICVTLWKNKKPIDLITVSAVCESKNFKNIFPSYVVSLTKILQTVPSNVNYKYYVNILKLKSAKRELDRIAEDLKKSDNPYVARDKALKELTNINENKASELEHISEAANEAMIYMADIKQGNKEIEGIKTPYRKLNYILGGLQKGEVTVMAARPGIGKSAILNEIDIYASIRQGKKVAIFNLEMSRKQIALRMYANLLNKSLYDLTSGQYDVKEIAMANEKLREAEIYVDVNSHTIERIMRACRVQKKRKGLDLVCVDYLQLVTSSDKKESRRVEVDDISRQLKLLAVELDIPIIALCQMNRGVETSDREPVLSDLRESGAIEQDASQVIFLHREKSKEASLGYREDIDRFLKVIVAKNRNGAVGSMFMKFEADKMKFIEVDKNGNFLTAKLTPTQKQLPF